MWFRVAVVLRLLFGNRHIVYDAKIDHTSRNAIAFAHTRTTQRTHMCALFQALNFSFRLIFKSRIILVLFHFDCEFAVFIVAATFDDDVACFFSLSLFLLLLLHLFFFCSLVSFFFSAHRVCLNTLKHSGDLFLDWNTVCEAKQIGDEFKQKKLK